LSRRSRTASQAREQESQQAGESKYKVSDNEQLEFLGDAVLAFGDQRRIVPALSAISRGRALQIAGAFWSGEASIQVAQQLELGHYLRLGRGEEKSGGRGKTALLLTHLEAILAAIYLDGGLEVAREFVVRNVIVPELERMERGGGTLPVTDFKSALQEAVQSLGLPQPAYVMVEESGPEHSKTFTVEARLTTKNGKDAEFVGRAQGSTKKTAEQDAARQLLTFLASRPKGADTAARSVPAIELHPADK